MEAVKKVGNFTFSHIGNGLYKADTSWFCKGPVFFEGMPGGGDLMVLYIKDTEGMLVEAVCNIHDTDACAAMHRYRDDNYTNLGVNASLVITQDLNKIGFGGVVVG